MKFRSISLLLIAEVAPLTLWFVSSAILPDMLYEYDISAFAQAALTSAVQAGFVLGALIFAFFNLPDRFDPRKLFALCALAGGAMNLLFLAVEPGSAISILIRFLVGALLAGVYPVGMKIAIGWGDKDRGFLVGLLVGALTLGSAAPHLVAYFGGADWRLTIVLTSLAAMAGGMVCLGVGLGPHHAQSARFDPRVVTTAWTNVRVRLAIGGYLGHMWELYVMWAWISAALGVSFAASLSPGEATDLAKLTTFIAIAAGGLASIFAGRWADQIGKTEVTIVFMALSGLSAILTGLTFGGAVWISIILVVIWGVTVIPDSAQFSALVAEASPPDQAGSLMTLQTALGFALTFVTVQLTPAVVAITGWPVLLAGLALGPMFGIYSMMKLRRLQRAG
ncbi:MAG: MFS transporter [Pseudomonadota bacterium]